MFAAVLVVPAVLAGGDEAFDVDGVGVARDGNLEDRLVRRVPKRGEVPLRASAARYYEHDTATTI